MMKSAEARSQAIAMFHTTAIRKRAFTSGSCGWGSSGSQKKDQEVDLSIDDLGADLLIASERPAFQALDGKIELPRKQASGRARCVNLVVSEQVAVEFRPFDQVALLVVVRDKRDLLVQAHRDLLGVNGEFQPRNGL